DHRAVLIADVRALPVQLRRIVLVPEGREERLVRDDILVVGDLDDLGVAGVVVADLLVAGVDGAAARVADAGRANALEAAEGRLDAPEAPCPERRSLLHYASSSFSEAELMQ